MPISPAPHSFRTLSDITRGDLYDWNCPEDRMAPSTIDLRLAAAVGLWALTVSSCVQGTGGPTVSLTDSAGVPLFTLSELPPWDDPQFQWRVVLERSIPTRAESSEADPLVYQPQGYARLPDGRLVVLDGADTRLVIIDGTRQEVLRRFGPSGQGPGEILSANSTIWSAGPESFWVLDPGNQRLSRFKVSGVLEEEAPVQIGGMAGVVFQDPVEHAPWFWKIFVENGEERTLVDSIGRLDPEGREVVYIAPMAPRVEQRRRNVPGEQAELLAPMGWFAPLGPHGVVAGRNDSGRFRVYSGEGSLMVLIEVPMERAPITESEKPALLEEYFGVARNASVVGRREVGDSYRLYDLMWGVADSLFALQQSHLSTPAGERRIPPGQMVWRVFSTAGEYAGAVVFPAGVAQPYWIEPGRVVATYRNDLGVATIQEFRLVRPGRPSRPDA